MSSDSLPRSSPVCVCVCVCVCSLLGEPNNDSPLNVTAAGMWDDQTKFSATVKAKYKEATDTGK